MKYYYSIDLKTTLGPIDEPTLLLLLRSGAVPDSSAVWCDEFAKGWARVREVPHLALHVSPAQPSSAGGLQAIKSKSVVSRIADYELVSGIIWITIAILQALSIVLMIAAIWNLIAGILTLRNAGRIKKLDPAVPSERESVVPYIIMACVNLLFGGVLGVLLVGLDLYIRHLILENRSLFESRSLKPVA